MATLHHQQSLAIDDSFDEADDADFADARSFSFIKPHKATTPPPGTSEQKQQKVETPSKPAESTLMMRPSAVVVKTILQTSAQPDEDRQHPSTSRRFIPPPKAPSLPKNQPGDVLLSPKASPIMKVAPKKDFSAFNDNDGDDGKSLMMFPKYQEGLEKGVEDQYIVVDRDVVPKTGTMTTALSKNNVFRQQQGEDNNFFEDDDADDDVPLYHIDNISTSIWNTRSDFENRNYRPPQDIRSPQSLLSVSTRKAVIFCYDRGIALLTLYPTDISEVRTEVVQEQHPYSSTHYDVCIIAGAVNHDEGKGAVVPPSLAYSPSGGLRNKNNSIHSTPYLAGCPWSLVIIHCTTRQLCESVMLAFKALKARYLGMPSRIPTHDAMEKAVVLQHEARMFLAKLGIRPDFQADQLMKARKRKSATADIQEADSHDEDDERMINISSSGTRRFISERDLEDERDTEFLQNVMGYNPLIPPSSSHSPSLSPKEEANCTKATRQQLRETLRSSRPMTSSHNFPQQASSPSLQKENYLHLVEKGAPSSPHPLSQYSSGPPPAKENHFHYYYGNEEDKDTIKGNTSSNSESRWTQTPPPQRGSSALKKYERFQNAVAARNISSSTSPWRYAQQRPSSQPSRRRFNDTQSVLGGPSSEHDQFSVEHPLDIHPYAAGVQRTAMEPDPYSVKSCKWCSKPCPPEHENRCSFRLVACPFCCQAQSIYFQQGEKIDKNTMKYLPDSALFRASDYQQHLQVCPAKKAIKRKEAELAYSEQQLYREQQKSVAQAYQQQMHNEEVKRQKRTSASPQQPQQPMEGKHSPVMAKAISLLNTADATRAGQQTSAASGDSSNPPSGAFGAQQKSSRRLVFADEVPTTGSQDQSAPQNNGKTTGSSNNTNSGRRCVWCLRPAPETHDAKCAQKRVACKYCGKEITLKERNAHCQECIARK